MGLISEAMRLWQNRQAEKDNRKRGEQDLRIREVAALEQIAQAASRVRPQGKAQ